MGRWNRARGLDCGCSVYLALCRRAELRSWKSARWRSAEAKPWTRTSNVFATRLVPPGSESYNRVSLPSILFSLAY